MDTMFLFVSRPLKILRNLQGKMGHAWSRGLTGISALLPNLPHIRGIYGQFSLAKPSIQRPNSNGVSRRFSKFESFTDQSGAKIKTTASTNR